MAKLQAKWIDFSTLWMDYDFDVTTAQTEFTGLASLISSGQKIVMTLNGRLLREGASHDYVRDVGNHKVTTNYNITNSWVRVSVYS
jgi:hypothetical protein